MSLTHILSWTNGVTRLILALLFTGCLVRVRLGSKYKQITYLCVLLLLNNIFGIWSTIPASKTTSNPTEVSKIVIYNLGLQLALLNICFNIAHLDLAWLYRKMAKDIPKVLDEEGTKSIVKARSIAQASVSGTVNNSKHQKCLYWALMALNVILPIMQGIAASWGWLKWQNDNLTKSFEVANDILSIIGILPPLISGVYLIKSVFEIKNFYKHKETVLNVTQMRLHASAFGLYMLSLVVWVICFIISTAKVVSHQGARAAMAWAFAGNFSFFVANFLSQALLAVIFWDLGSKKHVQLEDEEETIEEAPFDEDAELQARIWN